MYHIDLVLLHFGSTGLILLFGRHTGRVYLVFLCAVGLCSDSNVEDEEPQSTPV